MTNDLIKISQHPQEPNIDRFLIENTIVYKKRETPQYAKVYFDLVYQKNSVDMKDMEGKTREFNVSNANFVDTVTGMKFTPEIVENDVVYTFNRDSGGNIIVVNGVKQKTARPNTAKQYDFFKFLVDNKIKTEKELIVQYVAAMDAVQFFD